MIGVVGGVFSGLAGIGGGTVMVPLMVQYIGMRQVTAHGTSLAIVVLTALASASGYSRSMSIDWALVISIAIPSLLLAPSGAKVASKLDNLALRRCFAAFLLVVAVLLFLVANPESLLIMPWNGKLLIAILIGLLGGFLSGLLGIGGGVFVVPAAVFLLSQTQRDAQVIALTVMIPTSISGTIAHWRLGNVEWHSALWIAVLSVPAGFISGYVAGAVVPDQYLRYGFIVVLVYFSSRMFGFSTRKR
tara:strand:- start:2024 stop:2761 length:738 start_codon:yes stop_codon:yes gene_type:complete